MDNNVKAQSLFILSLLSAKIDKTYSVANILPSLKYIIDNDRIPAVSMAVIGCYKSFSDSLGPEYISSSVLPTILPLLVDRSLDRKQFETIVDLSKNLLGKMTEKRSVELNIDRVSWGERPVDNSTVDPFALAKQLMNSTRSMLQHQREAFNQKIADAPPPLPPVPPPPLPEEHRQAVASFGLPPPPPPVPPPPVSPNFKSNAMKSGFSVPDYSMSTSSSTSFPSSTVFPSTSSLNSSTNAPFSTGIPLQPLDSQPLQPVSSSASSSNSSSGKTSRFSWFSSSQNAQPKSSSTTSSSSDTSYQPPVVPISPPTGNEQTIKTSDSIDMDDFMSSFANKSKPTQSISSNPPLGMNNAPAILQSASSSSGWNSSTPSSVPPINSRSAMDNSNSLPFPSSFTTASSNSNQLSVEEQLKQTQAEIARLSANLTGSGALQSSSNQPATGYNAPLAGMSASYNAPNKSFQQSTSQPVPFQSNSQLPPFQPNSVPAVNSAYPQAAAAGQKSAYSHQFVTSNFNLGTPSGNVPPSGQQNMQNMAAYNSFPSQTSSFPQSVPYSAPVASTNNMAVGGGYNNLAAPQQQFTSNYPSAAYNQQPNMMPYSSTPAATGNAYNNYAAAPSNAVGGGGGQNFYSNYSSGSAGAGGGGYQGGNIGTIATGYQPPVIPPGGNMQYSNPSYPPQNNAQNPQNQKKPNNTGGAFDFLS
jgi:hypothetical protein